MRKMKWKMMISDKVEDGDVEKEEDDDAKDENVEEEGR